MTFPVQITMIEERPPDVAKRAFREMTRAGHQAQGKLWHSKHLPDHFRPGAAERYRHKPRTQKYLEQKRKLANRRKVRRGGKMDNVFTGHLEQMMRTAAEVRAFPTRVSITMTGPRYITMRPYKSNQPDKAKELTTVTHAQERELARIMDRVVTEELKTYRSPRKTKA